MIPLSLAVSSLPCGMTAFQVVPMVEPESVAGAVELGLGEQADRAATARTVVAFLTPRNRLVGSFPVRHLNRPAFRELPDS